jgi:betaine-aldehyde dehydrogenase
MNPLGDAKSSLGFVQVDSGKPIDEADWDIEDVAGCFAFYAERADATASDFDVAKGQAVDLGMDQFIGRVIKEPLGCVALITPWNYPLLVRTKRGCL